MSLWSSLLPALQKIRGIPDDLGVRTNTITVRTRTWSGGAVGAGSPTVTDMPIKPSPMVTETNGAAALKVGPITPDGAGYSVSQLAPANTSGVEFYYIVNGSHGLQKYALATIDTTHPFSTYLYLVAIDRPDDYADY